MRMLSKMLVVLTGGLFALLPAANAATCKGGKRADSAGRCKASPAKKAPTKAKVKAKSGKKAKAVAASPEKGPLYVFIESGGCRILATESSVRRMQEIAVGGAVTWDGRCAEGLISGTGVLRQEGVFIEGGRSKHFAYYYSGRAMNGVRTGPWTRETLERFDDSVRSWTSLARVEFVNGVAKGAPKPVPVRGADQHSKSFTTRVLDPEAKRAQAVAQATPPAADADALSLRPAPAVATVAPAVASPPSIPAPAAPTAPSPTASPAVAPAPTPAPLAVIKTPPPAPTPQTSGPPTAPTSPKPAVPAPVDVLPAPAPEPVKATAVKPMPPPVAPAPTPVPPAPTSAPPTAIKMPLPAPIPPVSVQAAPPTAPKPAVPATIAAPPPQTPEPVKVAAVKPAPPPVVPAPTSAPAAVPKAPPPAPIVAPPAAIQTTPAKPAVVVAPAPPAAVKLAPALPEAMQKQAFGFSTSCYMDTLDGQIWENAVLTVKDRSSLLIDGWAVDDEERVLAEATYLRLEGADGRRYHAATTLQERPDVARHFNTPAYVKAGYRTVVSVEGLPPGEYEATIVMSSKGRNLLCGNGRRMKL
jgi:hypothetical protein